MRARSLVVKARYTYNLVLDYLRKCNVAVYVSKWVYIE
jgi:hypothetical protein